MSFTDGKPHVVEERDLTLPWSGGKSGKYFRCYLCGHPFKAGDGYRWVYTNGLPEGKYGGNPIVCSTCDGPDVIERWKAHCDEARSGKFWWFRRDYE